MHKKAIQRITSYILNSLYLEEETSLDELGEQLYNDRPQTLILKEDQWEELNDTNSDGLWEVREELLRKDNGKLNSITSRMGAVIVTPSNLSISFATGQLDSFLNRVFERIENCGEFEKGYAFERVCESILNKIWEKCKCIGKAGDGGIDIICKKTILIYGPIDLTQVVQCKYYSRKIDTPLVRKLLGDVIVHIFDNPEIAMPTIPVLITNFGFTNNALVAAKKYGVRTLLFSDLIEEMYDKGLLNEDEIISCI